MIIAVDFDGTLCENKWPEIGEANDWLIEWLNYRQEQGDKIILWTCRSRKDLDEAVAWCAEHKLHFDAVNKNVPEIIEKFGFDCRKIYADQYIDDKNGTFIWRSKYMNELSHIQQTKKKPPSLEYLEGFQNGIKFFKNFIEGK